MILSNEQAIELCKKPENWEAIDLASQLQDEHKVHVTGEGYADYIKQIVGYEDDVQYAQKKELSEPVTAVLTGRIIDEQSRWKNTAGPKKFYNWKGSVDKTQEFNKVLSQVWKGESMEHFINSFLSEALYTEFNGFVLVEQGKVTEKDGIYYEERDGVVSVVQDNKVMPYLIFRPIELVRDFKSRGNKVEYIILDWGKVKREDNSDITDIQLYRVLDDLSDRIIEVDGADYTISKRFKPLNNKLGCVPAVQVSTSKNTVIVDEVKTSPIWRTIPLLKTYMTGWAEHVITCILHSHPIYYQMGQMCRYKDSDGKCDQGTIYFTAEGKAATKECPACKGAGSVLEKRASSAIILPQVDEQGQAFSITNVAGYVSPPVEGIKAQQEELNWIADQILQSGTGMNKVMETQIEKTATEAILNYKPLEKKISDILTNIEYDQQALEDFIGKLYFGKSFLGSQITYSRQLNLRDENTVLIEIEQAKNAGASSSYVKTLHNELIFTRYQNSPVELERNRILSQLEPFIGYTTDDMLKFREFITVDEMTMKVNFTDYIVRFENEYVPIQDFKEDQKFDIRIKAIKQILDGYNALVTKEVRIAQLADREVQSSSNEA